MNYPFTFNQMFNPYSDNPKFLKKVFNTRLIPVMIALLSVIIISLIFGDACIFGNSSSSGIILSPDDELTAGITSAYEGLVMTLTAAAVFLPFIGLVSLVVIVKAMGWIMGKKKPVQPVPMAPVQKEPIRQEVIPEANHGELVAAISAALATVMGKQVNGIRILSMKKVDE